MSWKGMRSIFGPQNAADFTLCASLYQTAELRWLGFYTDLFPLMVTWKWDVVKCWCGLGRISELVIGFQRGVHADNPASCIISAEKGPMQNNRVYYLVVWVDL